MRKRFSPWLVLVCTFLLFFVIYLTGAVWPEFVTAHGLSEGALGLIIGAYGLALLIIRLPIGYFCDLLIGYRRVVVSLGFLCIGLGLLLPVFSASFWPLVGSRILMGVGAGTFVALSTLYAQYFSPSSSRFSFAVVASFWGWGQIPANPLGGWLADRFGVLTPFWIAAPLALVGAVLVLAVVEPEQDRAQGPRALWPKSVDLYVMAFMMAVVFFGLYAAAYNITQLYAASELGVSKTGQGLLLMTVVSVFVIVVLLSPYLAQVFGDTIVVTSGMAFLGVGILLNPVANLIVLFFCGALIGTGVGLTYGLLMAMSVERIGVGQRFYAMGVFQAIYAVGMLLGPLTAGYVTQAFGFSAAFSVTGLAVLFAGLLFMLARVGAFSTTVRLLRG